MSGFCRSKNLPGLSWGKGWLISEGIVNYVPSSKYLKTVSQAFTKDKNVKGIRDSDLVHLFEDWTELKIPSEITLALL